jgi:hypothetical protein
MDKPKYEECRRIDEWRCCWCGAMNRPSANFDYDFANFEACDICGKRNTIYASVEYMSHPCNNDGEEM